MVTKFDKLDNWPVTCQTIPYHQYFLNASPIKPIFNSSKFSLQHKVYLCFEYNTTKKALQFLSANIILQYKVTDVSLKAKFSSDISITTILLLNSTLPTKSLNAHAYTCIMATTSSLLVLYGVIFGTESSIT